jgi:hypothetical protein
MLLAGALFAGSPGFAADPGQGEEPVKWKEIAGGKAQIQFYGFLRSDLIFEDSRPDSFETPLFILSEDPAFGAADQSNFVIHARLTRFGLNLKGGPMAALGGATPSGNLEMDFQNGGRETRPIIRVRHAYFKLAWQETSFLVGQTWDVFGPNVPTVNNDSTMWNCGNVGDRRPQLRLSWDPKAGKGVFSLAGAAGLTDGVDSSDLDNNGVRDGEASGRPSTQLRAGYSRPASARSTGIGGDRRWTVGLAGIYAWHETATPIAGHDTFRTRGVALDYKLPIWKRVSIQGEAWTGQDLSDFRGGIAQTIDTVTGEEIASRGGWVEVGVKVGSFLISPGYATDDPRNRDVPAGTTQANAGRVQNRAWYLSNRWQPDPSFLLGFDFLRWITDYKAFESGVDNRVNVYFQYIF